MTAIKVRIPEQTPLVRLYFDDACPYPGWYARYRRHGKRRKVALSTWDRDDSEGARSEAAELLHCPVSRVHLDTT